jgi:hypothetical protein
MTLQQLARLAREMREAQRIYFRSRTPEALERSKSLERRLDVAVKEILDPPPPGLFDREEG